MARHGTRGYYANGYRCSDCTKSTRLLPPAEGVVGSGVQAKIAGLADVRPGLDQVARCGPTAGQPTSYEPAAACGEGARRVAGEAAFGIRPGCRGGLTAPSD